MRPDVPMRWNWVRTWSGPDEMVQVVQHELRAFRDQSAGRGRRPWALTVLPGELIVASPEPGPEGWPACVGVDLEPLLDRPSPAEVLLQSILADVFVLVCAKAPSTWDQALDAIDHWPHGHGRRRSGGHQLCHRPEHPVAQSVASVASEEFERGVDAAWSVVCITAEALGAALTGPIGGSVSVSPASGMGLGFEPSFAWERMAERLRSAIHTISAPTPSRGHL